MYVVFFIFLIILLILTTPLYVKVKFDLNALVNLGYIKIYIFNILLFHYKIKYAKRKFILYDYKSSKKIDVSIDKENIQFINQLRKEIFKRIYLSKINMNLEIGLKNNPTISAIVSGLLHSFFNVFYSNISFKKPTSNLKYNINTYYTKNMAILNSEILCASSMLNLFLSFIKAKNYIKNLNNKKGDTLNKCQQIVNK